MRSGGVVKTAGGLTSRLYHQLTGCFCVSDFPTCNRRVSHTSYSTGLLSDVAQHDEHPMSIRCSCPVLQGGSGALRKPLTQHPDPESGTTHPLGGGEAWILGQTDRKGCGVCGCQLSRPSADDGFPSL